MGINSMPDEPPIRPGSTVGDTGTGMLLAMGIIAALFQRVTTGNGQHIHGYGVIAEETGIRDVVAAAVPAEVDADNPATADQPTGQRVVHAGAEPVRMQQEERWARTAPVQVGDSQAVAGNPPGDGRIGHRWHVLRSSGGHGVAMGGSLADHRTL